MVSVRLEHDDMLQAIPRLVAEGVLVDACVTDAPYHLTATVKRFGATKIGGHTDVEQRAQTRGDGLGRLAGGFMGQQWDGGDIAFRPETWATVASIMRPGAFLVAFGGTRTHHRVWCAIEDGGFVIQDTIMWLFGSGFPKRRDMLKPAFEPICLAYKPGGKRTMQVDECRIGWASDNDKAAAAAAAAAQRLCHDEPGQVMKGLGKTGFTKPRESIAPYLASMGPGRWPANICHDGSDEVLAAFPQSAGQQYAVKGDEKRQQGQVFSGYADPIRFEPRGDSGSAARFFWSPKAGAEDRWGSRHPTVKPVELMKWLVQLVTPPGGLVLDPFAGSGTTGAAALATGRNAILIEREEAYVADIRERIAFYEGEGRHSLAAKARRAPDKPLGGLFDAAR
jgi:site-specific DNA-methyltransferase (adenine-specific)